VEIAEFVGIKILKVLYMENINMFTFKHPKYYKELRARNKSDQAISEDASTEATSVRPDPGLKRQAEASSRKRLEARSGKQQATSSKHK